MKSLVIELVLCLFLGMFGAHRFYAKKYGTAILYLFTYGLLCIGWIYDLVTIIIRMVKYKRQTDIIEPQFSSGARMTPIPSPAVPAPISTISDSIPISNNPGKTYKVAGVSHYLGNLLELAIENTNYSMSKTEIINSFMTDEKIWKYDFYPESVELVPEPDNPHDPNAIMVLVNGNHVGYIKAGSCSHLLKVLKSDGIEQINCRIGGGPYKYVYEDENTDKYEIEKGTYNYSVTLSIVER